MHSTTHFKSFEGRMGIAVLYSDDQENVGFYTYRAISCIKIRRIVMYLSISIPKMALHANEGSVRINFR